MLMPGEHLSDMEHRYPARKMDDGAPHLVYARPREPGNPEFGNNPGRQKTGRKSNLLNKS